MEDELGIIQFDTFLILCNLIDALLWMYQRILNNLQECLMCDKL